METGVNGRSRRISPPRSLSLSLSLTLTLTLILNQGGEILRERRVNAPHCGRYGILNVDFTRSFCVILYKFSCLVLERGGVWNKSTKKYR